MKKRKELLRWGLVILIGVGCILLMCVRAEQVDKAMEASYEERY